MLITSGTQASLDLVVRLLVGKDDLVWMEDPGYPSARIVLESVGARLTFVPVNAHGLEVGQAKRSHRVLAWPMSPLRTSSPLG